MIGLLDVLTLEGLGILNREAVQTTESGFGYRNRWTKEEEQEKGPAMRRDLASGGLKGSGGRSARHQRNHGFWGRRGGVALPCAPAVPRFACDLSS